MFESTMKIITHPEDRAIERLLASFYLLLAAAFLVFSVGSGFSIAFRWASYIVGAITVMGLYVLGVILANQWKSIAATHRQKNALMVVLCALTVGVLTSSINRPDIDDSVYAPKAVFYTEHPDEVVGNAITWVAGLPAEANSFVFQYYETLQASLAWLLGVHFLALYHVAFPFLVGFLAFLSVYLLLGLFYEETRVRLAGAVCLVLLALLLGETHRTYGNLSVARAFHGKFVLFYLGFYNWTYFSLRYFHDGKWRQLIFLSMVAVALTALTTTAFIFIPFLSLVLFLSFFLSRRELLGVRAIQAGAGFFVALLPTAFLALNFRQEAQKVMPAGSSINSGFSADFSGQLGYLVSADFPLTPVLFIVSLVMVIFFSSYKRFFVLWALTPFVLLLNPGVSGFVMKHVTTENAYWRLFYILPFPLLSVIVFCSVAQGVKKFNAVVGVTFFILGGAVVFLPSSVFRRDNAAKFELMGYKIHEPIRSYVNQFARTMSPGSVFASVEISSNMVINTSKFPQYYLREDYLRLVVGTYLGADKVLERTQAASYLYGGSVEPSAKEGFIGFVGRDRPDYVISNAHSVNHEDAARHLTLLGYTPQAFDNLDYQVWKR